MAVRIITTCDICGKEYKTDLYYPDYGLVRLDGRGDTQIEFNSCSDCLPKVTNAVKALLKKRS